MAKLLDSPQGERRMKVLQGGNQTKPNLLLTASKDMVTEIIARAGCEHMVEVANIWEFYADWLRMAGHKYKVATGDEFTEGLKQNPAIAKSIAARYRHIGFWSAGVTRDDEWISILRGEFERKSTDG
jgi:hypothetical protein